MYNKDMYYAGCSGGWKKATGVICSEDGMMGCGGTLVAILLINNGNS